MGRAGRDGQPSTCHLFLSDPDFTQLRSVAHADGIDSCQVEALLEEVFCADHAAFTKKRSAHTEGKGTYGVLEIAPLVSKLDMKEEVLETILSYIEVNCAIQRCSGDGICL